MGERFGAPSGFGPVSIVISKPPVAVQLPQPDVSANVDAPQINIPSSQSAGNRIRACAQAIATQDKRDSTGHDKLTIALAENAAARASRMASRYESRGES